MVYVDSSFQYVIKTDSITLYIILLYKVGCCLLDVCLETIDVM